jgi:hypothetical protein
MTEDEPRNAPRFEVGQRVTSLRSQPGGHRFVEPIAGIVRDVTTMRVRIEVALHSQLQLGGWVRVLRDVRPERLRPREGACADLGEV